MNSTSAIVMIAALFVAAHACKKKSPDVAQSDRNPAYNGGDSFNSGDGNLGYDNQGYTSSTYESSVSSYTSSTNTFQNPGYANSTQSSYSSYNQSVNQQSFQQTFQQSVNTFQQSVNTFQQSVNTFQQTQQSFNTFQQSVNTFQQSVNTFQQSFQQGFQQSVNTFQQSVNTFQQGFQQTQQSVNTFQQGFQQSVNTFQQQQQQSGLAGLFQFGLVSPYTLSTSRGEVERDSPEQRLLNALNATRQKASSNLPMLRVNKELQKAANAHARLLKEIGYRVERYDHASHEAGRKTFNERMAEVPYKGTFMAENWAVGPRDLGTIMNLWLNSSPHRRNIMLLDATEVGLAVVKESDNAYHYLVIFAHP